MDNTLIFALSNDDKSLIMLSNDVNSILPKEQKLRGYNHFENTLISFIDRNTNFCRPVEESAKIEFLLAYVFREDQLDTIVERHLKKQINYMPQYNFDYVTDFILRGSRVRYKFSQEDLEFVGRITLGGTTYTWKYLELTTPNGKKSVFCDRFNSPLLVAVAYEVFDVITKPIINNEESFLLTPKISVEINILSDFERLAGTVLTTLPNYNRIVK